MPAQRFSMTAAAGVHAKLPAMKLALRIAATVGLAGLLVLYGFGFLSTFEPLPAATRWSWRAGFALASVITVLAVIPLWRAAGRVVRWLATGWLCLGLAFVGTLIYLAWSAAHGRPL